MIVSADGLAVSRTESTGSVSMIVSATGTAYAKRGKVAAVIRFIKRGVRKVDSAITFVVAEVKRVFMATKTGKPTSIDPPAQLNS